MSDARKIELAGIRGQSPLPHLVQVREQKTEGKTLKRTPVAQRVTTLAAGSTVWPFATASTIHSRTALAAILLRPLSSPRHRSQIGGLGFLPRPHKVPIYDNGRGLVTSLAVILVSFPPTTYLSLA